MEGSFGSDAEINGVVEIERSIWDGWALHIDPRHRETTYRGDIKSSEVHSDGFPLSSPV